MPKRYLALSILILLSLFVLLLSQVSKKIEEAVNNTISPIKTKNSVLVDNNGGRVDWSQINNLIAFSKFGNNNSFNAEIYTMNEDGSNQVCVTCGKLSIPHLSNDQPAWHPNGNYILFQSVDPNLFNASRLPETLKERLAQGGAGIDNNLWIVTKDGTKFYQLTHVKDGEAALHPHFSHDGRKLFWAARQVNGGIRNGQWMLKIADFIDDEGGPRLADEKTYQPLGKDWFYESHDFTPDDKTVIFSASPPGPYDLDIYKMDLDTQKITNLTDSPGVWDEHAHITPDGKKIVWVSSQGYPFTPTENWGQSLKTDLWMMSSDGSNKQQITFFDKSGSSEYNGKRVIIADNSWNPKGNKLVIDLVEIDGIAKTSKIEVIDF